MLKINLNRSIFVLLFFVDLRKRNKTQQHHCRGAMPPCERCRLVDDAALGTMPPCQLGLAFGGAI